MTIDQIKEWRAGSIPFSGINADFIEIIDTLLAEVERLTTMSAQ